MAFRLPVAMIHRVKLTVVVLTSLALLAHGLAAQQPAEIPADSTRQAVNRFFVWPILGYAPETRFQFGIALGGMRRPAGWTDTDRPSGYSAVGILTQRRQRLAQLSYDWWAPGNRWHVVANLGLLRFPADFYGIGLDTPDSSERYTPRIGEGALFVQRQVAPGRFVGGSLGLRDVAIVETVAGGRLDSGSVTGSRGGTLAWIGGELLVDERDNLFFPTGGRFARITGFVSNGIWGSDFDLTRWGLEVRAYRSLGPRRVLAFNAQLDAVVGAAPFDWLPNLGGERLVRGYVGTRYRDRALVAGQVELRTAVWGRLGTALFVGAGSVARDVGSFRGARAAAGIGARWLVNAAERFSLRLDMAWGSGSSGLYLGLGEAF